MGPHLLSQADDDDGDGGAPLRVCYFNRSYWPDTGATGQLLTELAEDLVADPRHRGHGRHRLSASGRRRARRVARRATAFASCARAARRLSPRRFAGRATNYLTYFLSALWIGAAAAAAGRDVALTDPPIIGLAALAARPRHGMVFFCQDIFPEVAGLLEDFHSPLINALLERLNRFLVRRAAPDRRARRHDERRAWSTARAPTRRRSPSSTTGPTRRRSCRRRRRTSSRARTASIRSSSSCMPATSGCRRTSTWCIDAAALLTAAPRHRDVCSSATATAARRSRRGADARARQRPLPAVPAARSAALDLCDERRVPGVAEARPGRLHRAEQAVSDPRRRAAVHRGRRSR